MAKPQLKIPVRLGDQLELAVNTLASSGDGLCRHEGYTLFTPGALPGDRVIAEIIKTTPRFGVTRVVERLDSSPDRVTAPCPAFPACGGCKFQDMDYQSQLAFKVQVIEDSLRHIAKMDNLPKIVPLPPDAPYHYRNKGSFAVQLLDKDLRVGFYRHGTHEVIDSNQCDILVGPINEIKEWIRGLLKRHRVVIYDETKHKGFFRGLMIRHSESTGETLIGLITAQGKFPRPFMQELTASDPLDQFHITGIVQNLNLQNTNIILGEKNRVLWGENRMREQLGDLQFQLSLGSFFQVNSRQTEKLYDLIRQWAEPLGGVVIDAYCGVGCIALCHDARESAQMNDISNCEFLQGAAEERLPAFAGQSIETLVLDPPRKGCSEKVMDAIPQIQPEQIIYVSCNPSTLARDLARLPGYAIADIRAIDLFPQTHHVETAVLLKKK
jgi:23S rRNA (uracil1939-C5)-methyltransferase